MFVCRAQCAIMRSEYFMSTQSKTTKSKGLRSKIAQLESPDPKVGKPRLVKLIVKNYRCIGATPVEIDLDDIVILVGANNTGKSSILRAYKLAMSQGSGKATLTEDDFHRNKDNSDNLPAVEIEIHTAVYDDTVGARWIKEKDKEDKIVKEKWIWQQPNQAPVRYGFDVEKNDWDNQVPWGAPNVANSKRPEPYRVDAFAAPEKHEQVIKRLLNKAFQNMIQSALENSDNKDRYAELKNSIATLQGIILSESKSELNKMNAELSEIISKIFPNYAVNFNPQSEDVVDKSISLFASDSKLLLGPRGQY